MRKVLLYGTFALVAALAMQAVAVSEEGAKKQISIEVTKLEEADAAAQIGEPNYGYVGELGAFCATKSEGHGMIVVHNYPDTTKAALGAVQLSYVGPKRVGNVDGWVFKTQWDGKSYPSRIFFSAEEVYFGGGISAYIVADYRDGTGWVWKMLPMRRLEILPK
jgi:hypothetical protein